MGNRKEIPYWVTGYCGKKQYGTFFNKYGVEMKNNSPYPYKPVHFEEEGHSYWFSDIEDEELVFYAIHVDNDGFYGVEIGRFHFNEYSELEGWLDKYLEESFHNRCLNGTAIMQYLMPKLIEQPYYSSLYRECAEELLELNEERLFYIFYRNLHKVLPTFFEAGLPFYAKDILEGRGEDYRFVVKKHLELAKDWHREVSLSVIIKLCKSYNPQVINKFCQMLQFFRLSIGDSLSFIVNDMDIENLAEFGNYIIRCVLIYGTVLMNAGNAFSRFLIMYRDYINLIRDEEEKDIYPENLRDAHDAAVDRNYLVVNGIKYDKAKFKASTDAYKHLEWEDGAIKIVVPETPDDLIKESAALHHCVRSYITAVTDGSTQILLARNEDKPYMTIEVKEDKIRQAKRAFNASPCADDVIWLERYAKEKGLVIMSY